MPHAAQVAKFSKNSKSTVRSRVDWLMKNVLLWDSKFP